jgi:hypothetical protein
MAREPGMVVRGLWRRPLPSFCRVNLAIDFASTVCSCHVTGRPAFAGRHAYTHFYQVSTFVFIVVNDILWNTRFLSLNAVSLASARRPNWRDHVNAPQTEAELAALRRCVQRAVPSATRPGLKPPSKKLGLEITPRPRRRPRKAGM